MKHHLKRVFGRKYQMLAIFILAISCHLLAPRAWQWEQYVGYLLTWAAMLMYGMDNYSEGMDTGVKIMTRMQS